MARPIKHGLDYFPFDVDLFSDEKMVAISGEFGIKGEITTIKLLCAVYRNGYFIEWTEMMKFKLLKELPGVSADLLEQIIRRLVKWEFFDKDLFDSASILTSKGIQRRYQAISTKMHRKNAITQFCLTGAPQPATSKEKKKTAPKPKRKILPAAELEPQELPAVEKPAPVSVDDSVAAMLSDSIWNETVCMRYKLTAEQFRQKVTNFRLRCKSLEKNEHASVADAKRHFCILLSAGKLEDVPSQTTKTTPARNSSSTDSPAAAPSDYTFKGGFGGLDV